MSITASPSRWRKTVKEYKLFVADLKHSVEKSAYWSPLIRLFPRHFGIDLRDVWRCPQRSQVDGKKRTHFRVIKNFKEFLVGGEGEC